MCERRYSDTLAALLRGLGYNEFEILSFIKDEHKRRKLPVAYAWETIRAANLGTGAQAIVEALEEIDGPRTWTDDSFDDVPF